MHFKKGIALLLLLAILSMFPLSPVTAVDSESLEIIAPQQVKAGEQFSFAIKTNSLSEYAGISFSTDSERAQLPDNLLLSQGSENINLKASFLDAGQHFLKAYELKNPSKCAVVKINVQPYDPQFGSISPRFIGVRDGGSVKFKTSVTDKYGNLITSITNTFTVETVSGNASVKFVGTELYASGSGECKVYLVVNSNILDVADVFIYARLSDVISPDFVVSNPLISCYSDFNIEFDNASKKIPSGTNILIGFPNDFIMPCYCTRPITSNDITINGKPILNNPPKIADSPFTHLSISIPEEILPYEHVKIFIKKDTLIKNPREEGSYGIKMTIPQYDMPFFSNSALLHSPITSPVFNPIPSIGGKESEWEIHFTLRGYSLKKGDEIGIAFPFGTILPDSPQTSYITINGTPLLKGAKVEKFDSRTYIVSLPFDIDSDKDLWIIFARNIGIKLPLGEEVVHGAIYINFNISPIDSLPFYVEYVPFIEIEAKTDREPSLNNYFNKNVVFSLYSFSSIFADEVSISYSINGSIWRQYSDEMLFDSEGTYAIRYKALDKWGITSVEREFVFSIDRTPPFFYLDKIEPVGNNKLKYLFRCSEPLSYVTINGFYTICGSDKTFYAIFEKGRFDLLKIHAIDLAGNETLMEISISNHKS